MTRDLKLNPLRYTKQSSSLVLEQHSHCEVPAGCGGVVLRWRDPTNIPLEVDLYLEGKASFAIDGVPTKSSRPLVAIGAHVLSFAVEKRTSPIFFSMLYDRENPKQLTGPAESAFQFSVL